MLKGLERVSLAAGTLRLWREVWSVGTVCVLLNHKTCYVVHHAQTQPRPLHFQCICLALFSFFIFQYCFQLQLELLFSGPSADDRVAELLLVAVTRVDRYRSFGPDRDKKHNKFIVVNFHYWDNHEYDQE